MHFGKNRSYLLIFANGNDFYFYYIRALEKNRSSWIYLLNRNDFLTPRPIIQNKKSFFFLSFPVWERLFTNITNDMFNKVVPNCLFLLIGTTKMRLTHFLIIGKEVKKRGLLVTQY